MNLFEATSLKFRRKIFVLAGAKIDITDTQTDTSVGFIQMKAFKLKEDIRIFTDASMTSELLSIKARSVIDFGATYDVTDPQTGQIAFSLRRKGLRSTFVRDKWLILDPNETEIGSIAETGKFALMRRYFIMVPYVGILVDFIFMFMKINYDVFVRTANGDEKAAVFIRQKNPFVISYVSDTSQGNATIDNRIMVASGTLLSVIEIDKN